MSVEGALDRCDAELIVGWVVFTEDPARKARLEIYDETRLLGSCVADRRRPDVAGAGMGDGRCGFEFVPPRDLPEAALRRIVIRIVDTEFAFRADLRGLIRETAAADQATRPSSGRRFRTCILHIGTEKTGTTSLQRFFALNRPAFAKAGYFLPLSLAPNHDKGILSHIDLATYAMDDTRFGEDMRKSVGVHDANTLLRYRRLLQLSFEEEVAKLDANCDVMLLSNEHCHSRLFRPREVQRLKELLDPYCDRYEVVVYLRSQHEMAMSLYGLAIATGVLNIDMFPPMPPPPGYSKVRYTDIHYFDYYGLMLRWTTVFGMDAVKPRLYARDQLRNGDIVDDFMRDIPIDMEHLVRPDAENTNVSETAQRFMMGLFRHIDDQALPNAENVRKLVRKVLRTRHPGRGIMPAGAAVAEFLERFRYTNEQVRQRWFPERSQLFDVDLSKFPETQAPIEMSAAEIYPIVVELLSADAEAVFDNQQQG